MKKVKPTYSQKKEMIVLSKNASSKEKLNKQTNKQTKQQRKLKEIAEVLF